MGDEEDEFKQPVGLATLAKLDWSKDESSGEVVGMLEQLSEKMRPLMKLLRENNCFPSMPLSEVAIT